MNSAEFTKRSLKSFSGLRDYDSAQGKDVSESLRFLTHSIGSRTTLKTLELPLRTITHLLADCRIVVDKEELRNRVDLCQGAQGAEKIVRQSQLMNWELKQLQSGLSQFHSKMLMSSCSRLEKLSGKHSNQEIKQEFQTRVEQIQEDAQQKSIPLLVLLEEVDELTSEYVDLIEEFESTERVSRVEYQEMTEKMSEMLTEISSIQASLGIKKSGIIKLPQSSDISEREKASSFPTLLLEGLYSLRSKLEFIPSQPTLRNFNERLLQNVEMMNQWELDLKRKETTNQEIELVRRKSKFECDLWPVTIKAVDICATSALQAKEALYLIGSKLCSLIEAEKSELQSHHISVSLADQSPLFMTPEQKISNQLRMIEHIFFVLVEEQTKHLEQLEAMREGGDDFLSTVRNRILKTLQALSQNSSLDFQFVWNKKGDEQGLVLQMAAKVTEVATELFSQAKSTLLRPPSDLEGCLKALMQSPTQLTETLQSTLKIPLTTTLSRKPISANVLFEAERNPYIQLDCQDQNWFLLLSNIFRMLQRNLQLGSSLVKDLSTKAKFEIEMLKISSPNFDSLSQCVLAASELLEKVITTLQCQSSEAPLFSMVEKGLDCIVAVAEEILISLGDSPPSELRNESLNIVIRKEALLYAELRRVLALTQVYTVSHTQLTVQSEESHSILTQLDAAIHNNAIGMRMLLVDNKLTLLLSETYNQVEAWSGPRYEQPICHSLSAVPNSNEIINGMWLIINSIGCVLATVGMEVDVEKWRGLEDTTDMLILQQVAYLEINGICGFLKQNVAGLIRRVADNITKIIDEEGRPSNSLGILKQGGIAQALSEIDTFLQFVSSVRTNSIPSDFLSCGEISPPAPINTRANLSTMNTSEKLNKSTTFLSGSSTEYQEIGEVEASEAQNEAGRQISVVPIAEDKVSKGLESALQGVECILSDLEIIPDIEICHYLRSLPNASGSEKIRLQQIILDSELQTFKAHLNLNLKKIFTTLLPSVAIKGKLKERIRKIEESAGKKIPSLRLILDMAKSWRPSEEAPSLRLIQNTLAGLITLAGSKGSVEIATQCNTEIRALARELTIAHSTKGVISAIADAVRTVCAENKGNRAKLGELEASLRTVMHELEITETDQQQWEQLIKSRVLQLRLLEVKAKSEVLASATGVPGEQVTNTSAKRVVLSSGEHTESTRKAEEGKESTNIVGATPPVLRSKA